MVMGDDSCSRGRGFESWLHILDGHDIFHIDLVEKIYCLIEKAENKRKRGQRWPILLARKRPKNLLSFNWHFVDESIDRWFGLMHNDDVYE